MEENGNNQAQGTSQEVVQPTSSGISFPSVGEQKKSGGAKTLLIVGILILVGVLGFVIYKTASKKNDTLPEPTPFDNLIAPSDDTSSTAPTPTSTPAAVDKTKVKIQVQNGTGITGEAAYLQTQLKGLGYTQVTVGNSPATVSTTEVTFSDSLSSVIVSELKLKLNTIYQTVTTTTSASPVYDVVIVAGLRKGATPKPSVSASPTASPTGTPKATATPAV